MSNFDKELEDKLLAIGCFPDWVDTDFAGGLGMEFSIAWNKVPEFCRILKEFYHTRIENKK